MKKAEVILHYGDCLEVMPTLKPGSVAMVFADLPYEIIDAPWDVKVDLSQFWQCLSSKGKPNIVTIFTATQPFMTDIITSNRKNFRYDIVWVKKRSTNPFHAKRMPMRKHENIAIFYAKQPTYNPQKVQGPYRKDYLIHKKSAFNNKATAKTYQYDGLGMKSPTTVFVETEQENKRVHPTQKPVALLEWLIKTYTNDGDTILDPVAGSGTTAIAAINVGNRKVICIEKDPVYFGVMSKRIANHQSKTTIG